MEVGRGLRPRDEREEVSQRRIGKAPNVRVRLRREYLFNFINFASVAVRHKVKSCLYVIKA